MGSCWQKKEEKVSNKDSRFVKDSGSNLVDPRRQAKFWEFHNSLSRPWKESHHNHSFGISLRQVPALCYLLSTTDVSTLSLSNHPPPDQQDRALGHHFAFTCLTQTPWLYDTTPFSITFWSIEESKRVQHSLLSEILPLWSNFQSVVAPNSLRYQPHGSGTRPSFVLCRFASAIKRSAPPMYVSERLAELCAEARGTSCSLLSLYTATLVVRAVGQI